MARHLQHRPEGIEPVLTRRKNMKIATASILFIGVMSAGSLLMPTTVCADQNYEYVQDNDKQGANEHFKGKVEAVDPQAKTITVSGKTMVVNDNTKITKEGKSITLADIAVGDEVHGTSQLAGGKAEAITLTVSTKG